MKRTLFTLAFIFLCWQYTVAQQIIHTNTKSTCTYNGTPVLQNCADENLAAIFTFNENLKTFVHQVNGVDVMYAIESREFHHPDWIYRISNTEGVMYNLHFNQTAKIFSFYPVDLANGAVIYRYQHN
jgi:hypothetical protein